MKTTDRLAVRGVGQGHLRVAVCALAAAAVLLLPGCQSPSGDHRLMTRFTGSQLSERQLRVNLYDAVVQFSGSIETAADAITRDSEDAGVRAKALLWKSNAVPAYQRAAFDSDPVVGLLDVWVLAVQMRDYFDSPAAIDDFGDQWGVALEACRRTEADVETLATTILDTESSRIRGLVHEFAAANPMHDPVFTRASAAPTMARAKADAPRSLMAAGKTVEERLDDLADRTTIFATSLPKQARWQATHFADELFERPEVVALTALPEQLILTIAAEREALLASVDAQRVATLEFARAEREALLENIDAQRVATLELLREELAAGFEQVDVQRLATVEALGSEREQLLDWTERQSEQMLDEATDGAGRLVDTALQRAFRYALILVGIPTIALVLALLIGRGRVSLELARRGSS